MKYNIKEILYYFKKYHFEDTMIDGKECKLLYDYITNLQEENERLRKNQKLTPEQRNHLHLELDEVLEIYKTRNEKAIEYNKQKIQDIKDFYRPTEDIIYSGDTLIDIAMNNINILQGGDEE